MSPTAEILIIYRLPQRCKLNKNCAKVYRKMHAKEDLCASVINSCLRIIKKPVILSIFSYHSCIKLDYDSVI